jgi:DHA1 family multidrug resistance protein-like MFS transporter
LSNTALSASLIFIPNLAKDLGASDTEIGVISAVYGVAIFASSYLFGRASDVYDRKFIIRLGLFASAVSFFLQMLADPSFVLSLFTNTWLLAIARGLAGFSAGVFPPALMAYVYESDNLLGKYNSLGALGWSIGTFVAGLFAFYWNAFLLSSVCFWLAFLISLTMGSVSSPHIKVPFFPRNVIKKNWHVYLSFLLRHTGANCIWVIYPLYIASLVPGVEADKFWIGVIYTVNFASQFAIMPFMDRFKAKALIYEGLGLSALTFLVFTFAQDYLQLLPMQVLLGASWSLIYVGSLLYLMQRNTEKATCSGILSSVASLSMVLGSILGGIIAQFFDYKATMYVATILTLIAFVFFRVGSERNKH